MYYENYYAFDMSYRANLLVTFRLLFKLFVVLFNHF